MIDQAHQNSREDDKETYETNPDNTVKHKAHFLSINNSSTVPDTHNKYVVGRRFIVPIGS